MTSIARIFIFFATIFTTFTSCDSRKHANSEAFVNDSISVKPGNPAANETVSIQDVADSSFVKLSDLSGDFSYELKYATEDNFLKEAVYGCADCFLRYEVAKALMKANKIFLKKGYRIKLFDCYRPLHVQKKMWKIMPNAKYVANPYTSSSYHNRGCAVDLTLEDLSGHELDMGTPFDFFGEEAHYAYSGVPDSVNRNRQLLRKTLESVGFRGIRTEWWHFSKSKFPVSDKNLCDLE